MNCVRQILALIDVNRKVLSLKIRWAMIGNRYILLMSRHFINDITIVATEGQQFSAFIKAYVASLLLPTRVRTMFVRFWKYVGNFRVCYRIEAVKLNAINIWPQLNGQRNNAMYWFLHVVSACALRYEINTCIKGLGIWTSAHVYSNLIEYLNWLLSLGKCIVFRNRSHTHPITITITI